MPEATFDLTAMVDVVLLLIIFFMLSSQFAASQARPMDLPREKGEAASAGGQSAVIVDIDRDGTMSLVSGQKVTGDELVAMLKKAQAAGGGARAAGSGGGASGPSVELIVRAHREAPAVYVNRLAGLLARSGLRAWKLATQGDA